MSIYSAVLYEFFSCVILMVIAGLREKFSIGVSGMSSFFGMI